jgi:hypothetical protein
MVLSTHQTAIINMLRFVYVILLLVPEIGTGCRVVQRIQVPCVTARDIIKLFSASRLGGRLEILSNRRMGQLGHRQLSSHWGTRADSNA